VRFRWPLRCGPCCPAKLNRIELLRCACIAARYCRSVRRENCKCAARGDEPRGTTWPELETTRRTIPRGRLPHGSKCEILAASDVFRCSPKARSRCAPARCAGARAERPAAGREDSDGRRGKVNTISSCVVGVQRMIKNSKDHLRAGTLMRRVTRPRPITQ
jgi:hypothetical protein